MHTPLALWAGMLEEGQVGCSCLFLQALSDRAWAATLGWPARSLDDPARTPSVRGIQREKDYQVHLELLAVKSVQGSADSGFFILLTLLSIAQDIEGSFKRSETNSLSAPNKTHAFRPMPRIIQ